MKKLLWILLPLLLLIGCGKEKTADAGKTKENKLIYSQSSESVTLHLKVHCRM